MNGQSYPMTPVDCLISELREMVDFGLLTKRTFEERVAQFKVEVAADHWNARLKAMAASTGETE